MEGNEVSDALRNRWQIAQRATNINQPSGVRISVAFYTTDSELDTLVEAVTILAGESGNRQSGKRLNPFTLVAGAARSHPCSIRLTESSLDSGVPFPCRLSRRGHSTNGRSYNRQLDAIETDKWTLIVPSFPARWRPFSGEALADTPVVCLLGPRQSGKTTLVQQLAPDRAYVSLDDHNYYQTARTDPSGFVASLPDAVTLDEVQRAPETAPRHQARRDRGPSSRSFRADRLGQSAAGPDRY